MINKSLTLTLVIPAYNEQSYIAACLDSIATQTVRPARVIVVDNNSTDETARIARGYPFVTLLKEKRQGVLYARNRGFDAAESQIIGRIDADTVLPPDWVKNVLQLYRRAGAPDFFAAAGPSYFRNRGRLFWFVMHRLTYFWPSRLMLGQNTLVGSNMFLTRKLWRAVRTQICLRTDMHEDMDLAFHIGQTGTKVMFYPHPKAYIRARKMVRRSVIYPLMMYRVWSADGHSSQA